MSRLARVACTFMEGRGQKIYGDALRLDGNDFIEVPETADLRPQKVTLGTVVWDGSWHHVAGTYEGSMVRLFVDGMEIGALPVADIWGRISAMLHLEPAAPVPEDAREWFEGG
jgi:hypothetical protein